MTRAKLVGPGTTVVTEHLNWYFEREHGRLCPVPLVSFEGQIVCQNEFHEQNLKLVLLLTDIGNS